MLEAPDAQSYLEDFLLVAHNSLRHKGDRHRADALLQRWVAAWLGKALGFDPLAEGYNSGSIGGILLVGIGGGIGLQLARRVRPRKDQ